MKGDFTRFTFKREKNYSGVMMQQGRVQLDADFNEAHAIQQYLSQTRGLDVIGHCGVPRLDGGFNILTDGYGVSISRGRIYVDGILCDSLLDENPDVPVVEAQLVNEQGAVNPDYIDFIAQPYFPGSSLPVPTLPSVENQALYLFYLDVWERHITAVEDPEIREVALGGPDTTTRSQTVWQVKHLRINSLTNKAGSPQTCWDTPEEWTRLIEKGRGRLAAKTEVSDTQDDPCIVPAAAGYRRLENQLYRVEVHQGGTLDKATIKWSRDNGMIVTRLLSIADDQPRLLTVADPGKDEVLGFAAGQWIEISDRTRELQAKPGFLVRLLHVEGQLLEIENWLTDDGGVPADLDVTSDPIVRRWDHRGVNDSNLDTSGGALNISELMSDPDDVGYFELEGGVKVGLQLDGDNSEFHTGDYWLIPARAIGVNGVDGEIIWPVEDESQTSSPPTFLPPRGIEHHYCRLALVDWHLDGANDEDEVERNEQGILSLRHDCRPKFPALTEPDLYYISGDGQEAMPGYTDEPDNNEVIDGDLLPQPLRVGVSNCNLAIEGAWVMFEVVEGTGTLEPDTAVPGYLTLDESAQGITAFVSPTDAQGEVATNWRMQLLGDEAEDPAQLVRTTLLRERPARPQQGEPLDVSEYALDIPVMFGASFAVAWQNRYSGARFPYPHIKQNPDLKASGEAVEARTVEQALDQLRENLSLFYVNGDAQEAKPLPRPNKLETKPDEPSFIQLAHPLQVRVANGNWPYRDASVKFTVVAGDGLLKDESDNWVNEVILKTDNEGIATCHWKLDEWLWSQQVEARLVLDIPDFTEGKLSPVISDAVIRFNATLSVAEEVAYDGSLFPDEIHPAQIVLDVEGALDKLRENTALHYVGGDGQEAKRGEWLPQALEVRVANGQWPRPNAQVKFTVLTDSEGKDGVLQGANEQTGTELLEFTDTDGIAKCFWTPAADGSSSQRVLATLIDPVQDVEGSNGEIHFSAQLSIAEQVTYDGSVFPDEMHPGLIVNDVEAALDQLRENTALHYVGGDGQEAKLGEFLPRSLKVRVANGQWPRADVSVKFSVFTDLGSQGLLQDSDENSGTELIIKTDTDGIAECFWRPDADGSSSQRVIVTMVDNLQGTNSSNGEIHFSANLSIAEQVSYLENDDSELDPKPIHVQAALDELYTHKVRRSGDTITGDLTINGDLTVGGETTTVNTTELVIEDNIIRVNKGATGATNNSAGLEVFRSDTLPPAQLVWNETENQWKIGINGQLVDVAYGPDWVTLTEDKIADGLHRHSFLFADDTSTTPAARVDAAGNLGIGIASPQAKLHVNGSLRLNIGEGLEMLGVNNYFGSSLDARILRMIDGNGIDGQVDGGLAFEAFTPTDNIGKHIMSVRGNGNVGIGIKDPKGLLHVSCPGTVGGSYNWIAPADMDEVENTFSAILSVNKLTISNNGGNGLMHVHAGSGSVTVFVDIHNPTSGLWTTVFTQTVVEIVGSIAEFFFNGLVVKFAEQDVDGIRLRSSLVQTQTFHGWGGMLFSFSCDRIAGLFDGVVGIRKANPVFELDVNGIINASDIYKNGQPLSQLTPWNIGTNNISYNNGNVGVGTSSPAEKFTLRDGFALLEQGDVNTMGIKFNGAAAKTAPILRFHNPDSSISPYVWWSPRDGSLLSIEGGNVDGDIGKTYLRVTETGEMGIGTTQPNAGLVVSGTGTSGGVASAAIGIENTSINQQWLLEAAADRTFKLINNDPGEPVTALSVTAGGRLGIGTDAADTPVEIRHDLASGQGPVLGLSNRAGGVGATASIRFGVDPRSLTDIDQPNAQISAVNGRAADNATDLVLSAWSGAATIEYMRLGGAIEGVSMSQPLTATSISADEVSARAKRLVINHPTNTSQNLVHASLDGPEHAVFYRGEGLLVNGTAVVRLPAYFEDLTDIKGRTVQVTARGTIPFMLSCTDVANAEFSVHSEQLDGQFYWEVKAVRRDIEPLSPEQAKQ